MFKMIGDGLYPARGFEARRKEARGNNVLLLYLSIMKWRYIVDALVDDPELVLLDNGCWTCALCREYIGEGCSGCPVMEYTGVRGCYNTPYKDFRAAKNNRAKLQAALEEIEFLEMLMGEAAFYVKHLDLYMTSTAKNAVSLRADVPFLIRMSIYKWKTLYNKLSDDRLPHIWDGGSLTCALCRQFWVGGTAGCGECPIYAETGRQNCHDTPYYDYQPYHDNDAALREIEFLEELEKKYEEA